MRSFIRRTFGLLLTAAVTVTLAGVPNRGVAQHFDVFVTSQAGELIIGGYDDGTGTAYVPVDQMRVFEGEVIGNNPLAPYESESPGEPGFRASSQVALNNPLLTTPSGTYTALTALTPMTFSFLPFTIGANSRNLFFWDGVGAVDFAPISANYGLDLMKAGGGGWTVGIDGSTNIVVAGNTIQTTSALGAVHTHLFASIDNLGAAPDQGFYLYSLQLEMTGFTTSDSLYYVYGALDPASLTPLELAAFETAHGEAATWVQDNLVAPVPEPSTYALMGLAAIAFPLVRRFRRRR